ncbi:hypothetical protein AMTRI_Chr01g114800 [Amborella trichopoda]
MRCTGRKLPHFYELFILLDLQGMTTCPAKLNRYFSDNLEIGLYLGSIGVAFNKDALKQRNITHILTVAKSLDPAYPNEFICKKIEGMLRISFTCLLHNCNCTVSTAKGLKYHLL